MRLWIEHLFLNEMKQEGYPLESVLATSDGTLRLSPVEESRACIVQLLDFYWSGLQKPLKFFPKSSFAYGKKWEVRSARNDEFEQVTQAILEPLLRHSNG
jgi:exodeoxyribonuclease V gamma subunit